MGWFTSSRSRSPSRRHYTRSHAGSSYSSSSRHHSSTSHYKRRPRDGYIAYLYAKFRELWKQLVRYARRHPIKLFFMVIMPLLSGGMLHKVARQFGVELPGGNQMRGRGGNAGDGFGVGGFGVDEGMGMGMGGAGAFKGVVDGMSGLASVAKMAQAFM
ncbi:hypothetical protein M011DRAFT_524555 [Sporormia fimetaria CBS 119925]|uniref:Uncharacterized protein n=1 Tax=Sporormia fimetaria CBS 119925 TaxID=1340428 RepID=A0A6A6VJG5_9PLEO|nr:hypothetical protein M011DRAFT_524555 [Sporormia fimetaria CBS 119925]